MLLRLLLVTWKMQVLNPVWVQGLPVGLVMWWHGINCEDSFLPADSLVHISIAWAVGALMSFLSDTYRRYLL